MSNRKIIQVSSKYKAQDGSEKWRNVTVGSAFVRDNGEISLAIDPGVSIACLEGVRITIREPFDRDAQRGGGGGQRGSGGNHAGGMGGGGATDGDDLPFAPIGDIG